MLRHILVICNNCRNERYIFDYCLRVVFLLLRYTGTMAKHRVDVANRFHENRKIVIAIETYILQVLSSVERFLRRKRGTERFVISRI